jgi:hypothetical protein
LSLDAADFVDSMLTEQARLNSAADDGDVNSLVADFQNVSGEKLGLAETITPSNVGVPPHKWDDAQSPWGYWRWP